MIVEEEKFEKIIERNVVKESCSLAHRVLRTGPKTIFYSLLLLLPLCNQFYLFSFFSDQFLSLELPILKME